MVTRILTIKDVNDAVDGLLKDALDIHKGILEVTDTIKKCFPKPSQ